MVVLVEGQECGEGIGELMLKLCDYIFYRAARFYADRWKVKEPERFGFYIFFIVAATTLADLAILLMLATGSEQWPRFLKESKYVVVIFLILFGFFRYNRARFEGAKLRWDEEDPISRRRRGLWLKICCSIVIAFPFAFGILRYNLHWI